MDPADFCSGCDRLNGEPVDGASGQVIVGAGGDSAGNSFLLPLAEKPILVGSRMNFHDSEVDVTLAQFGDVIPGRGEWHTG